MPLRMIIRKADSTPARMIEARLAAISTSTSVKPRRRRGFRDRLEGNEVIKPLFAVIGRVGPVQGASVIGFPSNLEGDLDHPGVNVSCLLFQAHPAAQVVDVEESGIDRNGRPR